MKRTVILQLSIRILGHFRLQWTTKSMMSTIWILESNVTIVYNLRSYVTVRILQRPISQFWSRNKMLLNMRIT